MEILAPYYPDKPYQALFSDNCLEFRLDRRQTTYSLDDEDNVKLLLEVSGAGKTRQLLEMLYFQRVRRVKMYGSANIRLRNVAAPYHFGHRHFHSRQIQLQTAVKN